MNDTVVFRRAARDDVAQAFHWYERQRPGLGSRFEQALDRTLQAVCTFPEAFPIVHRDVRRALLRRFPYGVFYRVRDGAIHVVAVMHGRRDPALWRSRADDD